MGKRWKIIRKGEDGSRFKLQRFKREPDDALAGGEIIEIPRHSAAKEAIYCFGDCPNCFLKHLLKYFGSLKPTRYDISPMERFSSSIIRAATLRRWVLINGLVDRPVMFLIFS